MSIDVNCPSSEGGVSTANVSRRGGKNEKVNSTASLQRLPINSLVLILVQCLFDVLLTFSSFVRGVWDASCVIPQVLRLKFVWRVLRRLVENAINPSKIFKELKYDLLYHIFDWLPQILLFFILASTLPTLARGLIEVATYTVTWDVGFANERALFLFLLLRILLIRPFDRCFLWGLRYVNASFAHDLASLPSPSTRVILRSTFIRIVSVRVVLAIFWFMAELLADASQTSFVTSTFTLTCRNGKTESCVPLESRCVPLLDTLFVLDCWSAYPSLNRILYQLTAGRLGNPFSGLSTNDQIRDLKSKIEFPSTIGQQVGTIFYVLQHIVVATAIARELFDPLFSRTSLYLCNKMKQLNEDPVLLQSGNATSSSRLDTLNVMRVTKQKNDMLNVVRKSTKEHPKFVNKFFWFVGRLRNNVWSMLGLGPLTFPTYATAFALQDTLELEDVTSVKKTNYSSFITVRPWNLNTQQTWDMNEYMGSEDDVSLLNAELSERAKSQLAVAKRKIQSEDSQTLPFGHPNTASSPVVFASSPQNSFSFHQHSVCPNLVSNEPPTIEFVLPNTPRSVGMKAGSKPHRTLTGSTNKSVASSTSGFDPFRVPVVAGDCFSTLQNDYPGMNALQNDPTFDEMFNVAHYDRIDIVSVGSDGSAKTDLRSIAGGSDLSGLNDLNNHSLSSYGGYKNGFSAPYKRRDSQRSTGPVNQRAYPDTFEILEVDLTDSSEGESIVVDYELSSENEGEDDDIDPRQIDPIAYAASVAAAEAVAFEDECEASPSHRVQTPVPLHPQIAAPCPYSSYMTSLKAPMSPKQSTSDTYEGAISSASDLAVLGPVINAEHVALPIKITVYHLKAQSSQTVSHWGGESIVILEEMLDGSSDDPSLRLAFISSSLTFRAYFLGLGFVFLFVITSLPLCLGGILTLHLAAAAGCVLGKDLSRDTMLAQVSLLKTINIISPGSFSSRFDKQSYSTHELLNLDNVSKLMTALVYSAPIPLSRLSFLSRPTCFTTLTLLLIKLPMEMLRLITNLEFLVGFGVARPLLCSSLWLRQAARMMLARA